MKQASPLRLSCSLKLLEILVLRHHVITGHKDVQISEQGSVFMSNAGKR